MRQLEILYQKVKRRDQLRALNSTYVIMERALRFQAIDGATGRVSAIK